MLWLHNSIELIKPIVRCFASVISVLRVVVSQRDLTDYTKSSMLCCGYFCTSCCERYDPIVQSEPSVDSFIHLKIVPYLVTFDWFYM